MCVSCHLPVNPAYAIVIISTVKRSQARLCDISFNLLPRCRSDVFYAAPHVVNVKRIWVSRRSLNERCDTDDGVWC